MSAQINQSSETDFRNVCDWMLSIGEMRDLVEKVNTLEGQIAELQKQEACKQDPIAAPKKWHCGNGGGVSERWLVPFRTAEDARKAIYDECIRENFCIISADKGTDRYENQLKPFREKNAPNAAKKGDRIYLHCSKLKTDKAVTHWGKYTGKPPERITKLCGVDEPHTYAISVECWNELLDKSFRGAGRKKTLYEVTESKRDGRLIYNN